MKTKTAVFLRMCSLIILLPVLGPIQFVLCVFQKICEIFMELQSFHVDDYPSKLVKTVFFKIIPLPREEEETDEASLSDRYTERIKKQKGLRYEDL